MRLSLGELPAGAQTALLVPLVFRGQSHGLLIAFDRLADSPEFTADDERKHWARELHDETLQGLAALRVMLGAARKSDSPEQLDEAATSATRSTSRRSRSCRFLRLPASA